MIKLEKTDNQSTNIAVIKDFPNYYIDTKGNVFNINGIQLKPLVSNNGYLRVSISNNKVKHKKFLIHRLVAEAFIPNPENLPQVNHKDENKINNCVENLEWCTALENLNYSKVIEKAGKAKERKIKCVTTGEIFSSFKEVENRFGLSHSNLVACCMKRKKKCGGMEWSYII
jgi:hypothetical protein